MDILSKTYLIQRAAKEFEVHWQVKGDAQVIQRSVTQGRCINPRVTTSPTVGVYPKELKLGPQSGSQRDTYTHIFMTALLLQSRYGYSLNVHGWMNEWRKYGLCIYTMEYYSALKKWKNPAIWNNMGGLKWLYYAKWNKPDTERQILHDLIYTWNLKRSNAWKQSGMLVPSI